jgi:phage terminase large subunit-like protein
LRPGSRPTEAQQTVLQDIAKIQYRWCVAGNQSGKSALAAREIAWILEDTHPTWTRPTSTRCPVCRSTTVQKLLDQKTGKESMDLACEKGHSWRDWGTGPLKIIIAGQDRKMMELELWDGKLKKLLADPEEWREVRAGQMLQYVEHRTLKHQVIFISHSDSSEKNRKHMQGYVVHYVWLDEMPASVKILEELQRRVDAWHGYFLATFTPKFKNVQIRKVVDSAEEPIARRYRLSKLDNPLYAAKRDEELKKLAGYSKSMQDAILFGEWMGGDDLVYEYIPELHGGAPENYSPSWRHVLVVDPATESKLGLSLWAEDPASPEIEVDGRRSKMWWCVLAEYVEGVYVPTRIIQEVERRVAGRNIIQRRADTAASWYIRQAADMPDGSSYVYLPIEHKNDVGRKDGLIKQLQQSLGPQVRVADWCLPLVEEMQTYERNPDTGKLVGASKYHLIDCAHYFVDRIPEPDHTYVYASWDDRVYQAHLLAEREAMQARRYTRAGREMSHVAPAQPSIERPLPPMRQPGQPAGGWRRRKYRLS